MLVMRNQIIADYEESDHAGYEESEHAGHDPGAEVLRHRGLQAPRS